MLNIYLILIPIFLLLYYLYFLSAILKGLNKLSYSPSNKLPGEFISIIIPFRNESDNILMNLESIEKQNYPKDKFEVIYVNDSSEDDSLEKLLYANKSSNVKVISVPDEFLSNAHKKRAIRYGIENSLGEIIVTTDADCTHNSNWLRSLVGTFDEETGFVSGPVEFMENDSLFSKLQKLEFAGLVFTGAGLIGNDRPTICNAANIAYRKSIYDKVNGFDDHLNLSSGDDELLMQKIWKETDYKIKFCLNRDAIVLTDANESVKRFYDQRKRWASKGLFYADKLLVVKLILVFLFYLNLVILPAAAVLISINLFSLFLLSFMLKIIFEYKILIKGTELLYGKDLLKYLILAEIFQIPYIVIAGISGLFGNFRWKGRKVKR
ncbi:MAG: glycosyltransferase [Bacteroidetes bacterium]|nr:glycosyltransferase [Bacteroidota bacterium]